MARDDADSTCEGCLLTGATLPRSGVERVAARGGKAAEARAVASLSARQGGAAGAGAGAGAVSWAIACRGNAQDSATSSKDCFIITSVKNPF